MTDSQLLCATVVQTWKLVIGRFDKGIMALDNDQLQRQVAPGRNRLFYLLGHLTAVHDRMFPLLGIGERLYPELDEPYIANPDRALADPVSATELKQAWTKVNSKLTAAFESFTLDDWLKRHEEVSAENFAADPSRNCLAVVLNRTNHVSLHSGQALLAR